MSCNRVCGDTFPSTQPLTSRAAPHPQSLPRSYNALLADRAELEARYEARLRAAEEQASVQVVALDSQVGGWWAGRGGWCDDAAAAGMRTVIGGKECQQAEGLMRLIYLASAARLTRLDPSSCFFPVCSSSRS